MKKILELIQKFLRWIATDGALHFLVSALLVLSWAIITPLWLAAALTAVIGIGKEIVDLCRHGVQGYNWKNSLHDLICDAAGILQGTGMAALYLYAV